MPAHPFTFGSFVPRALVSVLLLVALLWAAPVAAQGDDAGAAVADLARQDLSALLDTLRDPAARDALIRRIETLERIQ